MLTLITEITQGAVLLSSCHAWKLIARACVCGKDCAYFLYSIRLSQFTYARILDADRLPSAHVFRSLVRGHPVFGLLSRGSLHAWSLPICACTYRTTRACFLDPTRLFRPTPGWFFKAIMVMLWIRCLIGQLR